MSAALAIVVAFLVFSVLIFLHELGHFMAAKLSGVQVNEFALFMGPALVKWQRGETQYSIRCIPIGGYCAMEGENEDTDNPRSFQKATWWKRLIILVAGSAMNFLTGLLIFAGLCLPGKEIVVPQIVEFSDYILPNTALDEGQIDANYFQHITYMNNFNVEYGIKMVSAAGIHYEPLGLYAGKTTSIDALPEGAQIAVPNDATNEARALLLLEQEGLIKLKEGAGIYATKDDVVENPKNIDIVETNAELLTAVLQDVDMAVINGNYAIAAELKIADALASESADGIAAEAYVNIITVMEGKENNPKIQALVKALTSAEAKAFMEETYEGAVVPLF